MSLCHQSFSLSSIHVSFNACAYNGSTATIHQRRSTNLTVEGFHAPLMALHDGVTCARDFPSRADRDDHQPCESYRIIFHLLLVVTRLLNKLCHKSLCWPTWGCGLLFNRATSLRFYSSFIDPKTLRVPSLYLVDKHISQLAFLRLFRDLDVSHGLMNSLTG